MCSWVPAHGQSRRSGKTVASDLFYELRGIARTADQRGAVFRVSLTRRLDFMFQNCTSARITTISDMNDHARVAIDGNPVMSRLAWYRTYQLTTANKARITQ